MNNIINRVWNRGTMVNIEDLRGSLYQNEQLGHTFVISGVDGDGNVVSLSGTVDGAFLRPDNTTVAISGSASGGKAYVTLPANCYDVPGKCGLTIYLTADSQKTALYAAVVTVTRTSSDTASPGTTASVVDLVNAINAAISQIPATDTAIKAAMAPTYSNTGLYAVGSYAWYNGVLKRCIVPITTAESYTAAHWTDAALGNDLRDLKSAFVNGINSTDNIVIENKRLGKYLKTNVTTVDFSDERTADDSDFGYAIFDCQEGDVFTISGTGGGPIYTYTFTKNDGTVVAHSGTAALTNKIVTTPAQATKLIVQGFSSQVSWKNLSPDYRLKRAENYFKRTNGYFRPSGLFGKKISIIGDSIDTYDQAGYKIDGYNMYYPKWTVTDVNKTWWKQLIDASGATLEVNASYSGGRVTDTRNPYPDLYVRTALIGSPDVVIISLGLNDSLNDISLGEFDYSTTYTELTEYKFRQAYIKGIKAIQHDLPNAQIICLSKQMQEAYRYSIESIANTLGCVYLDISDYDTTEDTTEHLHPGESGMLQIASLILYHTDKYLAQENVPADGKATGASIGYLEKVVNSTGGIVIGKPVLGKYINSRNDPVNYKEVFVSDDANFGFTIFDCNAGDIFTINGYTNPNGGHISTYAFTDDNGTCIERQNGSVTNLVKAAPTGATKLIVHGYDYMITVKGVTPNYKLNTDLGYTELQGKKKNVVSENIYTLTNPITVSQRNQIIEGEKWNYPNDPNGVYSSDTGVRIDVPSNKCGIDMTGSSGTIIRNIGFQGSVLDGETKGLFDLSHPAYNSGLCISAGRNDQILIDRVSSCGLACGFAILANNGDIDASIFERLNADGCDIGMYFSPRRTYYAKIRDSIFSDCPAYGLCVKKGSGSITSLMISGMVLVRNGGAFSEVQLTAFGSDYAASVLVYDVYGSSFIDNQIVDSGLCWHSGQYEEVNGYIVEKANEYNILLPNDEVYATKEYVYDCNALVLYGNANLISRNTITGVYGGYGIVLTGDRNIVQGNYISAAKSIAIDGDNNLIADNYTTGSVRVDGSKNIVRGCYTNSIRIAGDNNTIEYCLGHSSTYPTIVIESGSNNRIIGIPQANITDNGNGTVIV